MRILVLSICLAWLSCRANAGSQTADEIQQAIRQLGNDSAALGKTKAAAWVESPAVRGTADILWTCIVTLVACVYTVLHLNVPTKSGMWATFKYKIRWAFCAILTPETVLLVAVTQFRDARALRMELNKLRDKGLSVFDLQFCFFVVMKGFQVPIDGYRPGPDFTWGFAYPDSLPLSSRGFLKLVELGHFDKDSMMTALRLDDRSKAGIFQKILVTAQVLWMALQCIVRRAQGFPLALLEIHTMVHVVCTIFTYMFWFYKPLDIGQPEIIPLKSEGLKDFVAFAVQKQFCNAHGAQDLIYYERKPEHATAAPGEDCGLSGGGLQDGLRYQPQLLAEPQRWIDIDPDTGGSLESGDAFRCGVGLRRRSDTDTKKRLQFTAEDVRRVTKAIEFSRHLHEENPISDLQPFDPYYFPYLSDQGNVNVMRDKYDLGSVGKFVLFMQYFSNVWTLDITRETGALFGSSRVPFLLTTGLICMYAGIHLTAWYFDFPSSVESVLWRTSGLVLCASPATALLFCTLITMDYDSTWRDIPLLFLFISFTFSSPS
ncbi:hypothetical protein ColLi_06697 [Colletotrichum liriopes]|uniref:Uncharacterized protein n=1 Tax=Colletotrichum liriopes TaxID=708192 RepID=A0AA37LT31_9PEZI|nr:hypothetical protein ColLi_06697 [Colletotrichum liriopes]